MEHAESYCFLVPLQPCKCHGQYPLPYYYELHLERWSRCQSSMIKDISGELLDHNKGKLERWIASYQNKEAHLSIAREVQLLDNKQMKHHQFFDIL